jgi:hypothetical protein
MTRKYGDQNGVSKPDKKSVFSRVGPKSNETTSKADYADCSPTKLAGLVRTVAACGYGVLFTVTGDGGAFAITFFADNDRKKVYVPCSSDLDEVLDEWTVFFNEVKEGTGT